MNLRSCVRSVFLTAVILFLAVYSMQSAHGHDRYVLSETEVRDAIRRSESTLALGIPTDLLGLSMLGLFIIIAAVQFIGLYMSGSKLTITFVRKVEFFSPWVPVALRLAAGIFLISAGLGERIFTSVLPRELSGLSQLLSYLEIGMGILFIVGFLTKIAALLQALLLFYAFLLFGPHGLDRLELLGIALIVFFEGGLKFAVDYYTIARVQFFRRIGEVLSRYEQFSMPILRVTLGVALVWLGITEKLVAPDLTIVAIQKYNVPFFPEIRLFVFMFGIMEIIIGMHYLLGIFVRVISGIYLFLLVSAYFLFGESIVHLPLFGVAIAFLIRGAGMWRMHINLVRSSTSTHSVDN